MQASDACYDIIKRFEGLARVDKTTGLVHAYPDPATGGDPWTVGYGHTGPDVKTNTVWTKEQAEAALRRDVQAFASRVEGALGGARTTQGQFDALVSFSFNVGIGNLKSSTLLKLHKAGNYSAAATQFARWNKAAGKIMKGLTLRRAAEAALYRS